MREFASRALGASLICLRASACDWLLFWLLQMMSRFRFALQVAIARARTREWPPALSLTNFGPLVRWRSAILRDGHLHGQRRGGRPFRGVLCSAIIEAAEGAGRFLHTRPARLSWRAHCNWSRLFGLQICGLADAFFSLRANKTPDNQTGGWRSLFVAAER